MSEVNFKLQNPPKASVTVFYSILVLTVNYSVRVVAVKPKVYELTLQNRTLTY